MLVQETGRVTAPAPYECQCNGLCALLRARRAIRSRWSGGKHVATSGLNSAMAARYKGAAFSSQGISGETSFTSNGQSSRQPVRQAVHSGGQPAQTDPLARAMRLGRCVGSHPHPAL